MLSIMIQIFEIMCYNGLAKWGVSVKTFKKNLPEGVKKQFSTYKGVKVRLINKNTKKKSK